MTPGDFVGTVFAFLLGVYVKGFDANLSNCYRLAEPQSGLIKQAAVSFSTHTLIG